MIKREKLREELTPIDIVNPDSYMELPKLNPIELRHIHNDVLQWENSSLSYLKVVL
jgi:hypothetical protein